MRNIFHTQNMVKKLVPDPSMEIKTEHFSGSVLIVFYSLLLLYVQVDDFVLDVLITNIELRKLLQGFER